MDGQVGILLLGPLFGSLQTLKAGFLEVWTLLDKIWPRYLCLKQVTIVALTIYQVINGSIMILELGHT